MAYAFRAQTSQGNASGGALVVTKPTGTVDGDLIVVVAYLETGANTWTSIGAGFTLARAAQVEGTEFSLAVWWKIASGEPASWTWTPTTVGVWRSIVVASYSGATGSGPTRVDVSSTNSGAAALTTAQTAPTVTPTVTGDLLIYAYGNFSGTNIAATTGAATNVRISNGGTTIADNLAATTSATGTTRPTSAGSENFAAQHIAFFLNAAGGSTPISGPDSATLTEARAIAASAASADSATVTEATGIVASGAPSGTDSATLAEAATLAITLAAADSATATEGGSVFGAGTPTASDSAALTESYALTATLAASDSSALAEARALAVALAAADSATVGQSGNVGSGAANHNLTVGSGYTDVSPKQLVRTSADRLYVVVMECTAYPFQSGDRLIVYKANQTGVPSSFTAFIQAGITNASTVGVAIDGSDVIHIAYQDRSGNMVYRTWDTGTDTMGSAATLDTGLDTNLGQGEQSVAITLDSGGVPHVVYLKSDGTNRRVLYRNKVGGTWSGATTIDDQTFGSNQRCWHPNIIGLASGSFLIAWERGAFNAGNDGTLFARRRAAAGTLATTVNVSGTSGARTTIDQSTNVMQTADGRVHWAWIRQPDDQVRYSYSDDQGDTWSANNPGGGTQVTHNPSVGPDGNGGVRIYGHGTPSPAPDGVGTDLLYFAGAGGAGAWSSFTTYTTGSYDSSMATRWSQFFWNSPGTLDVAYWGDAYPNVLHVGSEIISSSSAIGASDSATQAQTATVAASATRTDSATVTEGTAQAATLASTDAATVTEQASTAQALALSAADSATVADAAAQDATLASTDAATVTEQASTAQALALSAADSATLADAAQLTAVDLAAPDAATLTEAAAQAATLASADAATVTDSSLLSGGTNPSVTDSAALTDTAAVTARSLIAADTATLADTAAPAPLLAATDGAVASEGAATVQALALAAADTLIASDTATVAAALAAADTAALAEQTGVAVSGGTTPSATDAATQGITATVAATLTRTDSATVTDAATVARMVVLVVADAATLAEGAVAAVTIPTIARGRVTLSDAALGGLALTERALGAVALAES